MSRSPMQLRREHQAVVHTVDEEPIASQIGGLEQRHCYKVQLSTMEYKVLWWLKEGSRDNEIAQRLGISPRTVNITSTASSANFPRATAPRPW